MTSPPAPAPERPNRSARTVTWEATVGARLLRAGFFLSAVLSIVVLVADSLRVLAHAPGGAYPALVAVHLTLLALIALGCLTVVVLDYRTSLPWARWSARITVAAIVVAGLADVIRNGATPWALVYVFQVVCLVSFQLAGDEALARNRRFHAPWDAPTDPTRRDFIPLNFFNLFWVFTVASVVGLVVEVVFHALTTGAYQDRAGMLWGPFSPIYGFGATLMTIALNRWWRSPKIVVFLVAGAIGSAFEFATSLFMEKAFGVTAWDYSGTFLNIGGRTNFAFFCAWGLLGLVWIKLLLPDVLRLVDAIPLRLRAVVTIVVALLLAVDGVMTLVTIDRWYDREAGRAADGAVVTWIDAHFDNEWMAHRFQTMHLRPERAERSH